MCYIVRSAEWLILGRTYPDVHVVHTVWVHAAREGKNVRIAEDSDLLCRCFFS